MHDLSPKDLARRDLRKSRADFVSGLSPSQRNAEEARLAQQVAELVRTARRLASYAPMGHEIAPRQIEQAAKADIGLPWFADRGAPMQFKVINGPLEPGPWGVAQPPHDAELMIPDVLIVPLVGATATCDRLGQGQGHFDQCVAKLRSAGPLLTIGLAWDCQIVSAVPTDTWDETLDYIATPSSLYARP
ncbi:MAG: 5-formyltetrahydrofolate cyclo-ligase [Pacificimonas sp.]